VHIPLLNSVGWLVDERFTDASVTVSGQCQASGHACEAWYITSMKLIEGDIIKLSLNILQAGSCLGSMVSNAPQMGFDRTCRWFACGRN